MEYDKKYEIATYLFGISIIIKIILFLIGSFGDLYLASNALPYILNYIILISVFFISNQTKARNFILVFLIVVNSFAMLFKLEDKQFYFKSPNNKNTIIIEECVILFSGYGNVYEKKAIIFKKTIDENAILIDGGYRPFSNEDYSIEWENDDKATIEYGFRRMDIRKKVTVDLKDFSVKEVHSK